MLLIPCPWCGPRDESEFGCGGEATDRPTDPGSASDSAWTDYLFMRANPRGVVAEQWCCSAGCGQWFKVHRHTATHEITNIARLERPLGGNGD